MQRLVQALLDRADDEAANSRRVAKAHFGFRGMDIDVDFAGSHSTNKAATACRSGGRKSR